MPSGDTARSGKALLGDGHEHRLGVGAREPVAGSVARATSRFSPGSSGTSRIDEPAGLGGVPRPAAGTRTARAPRRATRGPRGEPSASCGSLDGDREPRPLMNRVDRPQRRAVAQPGAAGRSSASRRRARSAGVHDIGPARAMSADGARRSTSCTRTRSGCAFGGRPGEAAAVRATSSAGRRATAAGRGSVDASERPVEDAQLGGHAPPRPDVGEALPVGRPPQVRVDAGAAVALGPCAGRDVDHAAGCRPAGLAQRHGQPSRPATRRSRPRMPLGSTACTTRRRGVSSGDPPQVRSAAGTRLRASARPVRREDAGCSATAVAAVGERAGLAAVRGPAREIGVRTRAPGRPLPVRRERDVVAAGAATTRSAARGSPAPAGAVPRGWPSTSSGHERAGVGAAGHVGVRDARADRVRGVGGLEDDRRRRAAPAGRRSWRRRAPTRRSRAPPRPPRSRCSGRCRSGGRGRRRPGSGVVPIRAPSRRTT